jgi:hypothetical protein
MLKSHRQPTVRMQVTTRALDESRSGATFLTPYELLYMLLNCILNS